MICEQKFSKDFQKNYLNSIITLHQYIELEQISTQKDEIKFIAPINDIFIAMAMFKNIIIIDVINHKQVEVIQDAHFSFVSFILVVKDVLISGGFDGYLRYYENIQENYNKPPKYKLKKSMKDIEGIVFSILETNNQYTVVQLIQEKTSKKCLLIFFDFEEVILTIFNQKQKIIIQGTKVKKIDQYIFSKNFCWKTYKENLFIAGLYSSLFEVNLNNYNVIEHEINLINNDTSSLLYANQILYIGTYKGQIYLYNFNQKRLLQTCQMDFMIQEFKLITMNDYYLIKIHSNQVIQIYTINMNLIQEVNVPGQKNRVTSTVSHKDESLIISTVGGQVYESKFNDVFDKYFYIMLQKLQNKGCNWLMKNQVFEFICQGFQD